MNSPGFWDTFVDEDWFFSRELLDWWNGKTFGNPVPAPAPSAPSTRQQMTDPMMWTPDIQVAANQAQWATWRQTAIPDPNYAVTNTGMGIGLVGLAVAGVVGYIVLKKVL